MRLQIHRLLFHLVYGLQDMAQQDLQLVHLQQLVNLLWKEQFKVSCMMHSIKHVKLAQLKLQFQSEKFR